MDRSEQMVIIGEIAADQWGLVTAKQAAAQGVNGVQLMRLTEASLLERVGRGVYLVPAAGYPTHLEIKVAWLRLAPEKLAWQREATDPDSGVISHASACLLHELGDIPAAHVEITVPRRRVTRESDVRLPVAQLDPADITLIDGLPVTTPERTIVDLLRAHIDAGHIGGVIADADHRSLISVDVLADRVQPFAKSYGLAPSTDGSLLIDHLVAQAGTQLREDDAKRAAAAAYTYGAADTFRRLNLPAVIEPNPVLSPTVLKILDSSLADREANLARMLAPLNEEATAAIARMAAPAAEMQAAIARMLAPLAEQLRASTGDVTLDRMLRADLRAAAQDRLGTDTAEDPQPPALPPATAERPQHEGESEAKDQPN
ncbi:type IV toxin-antitoxin system AbiEi family antitoxin domain-containing protein [Kitasatospora griseola]|uniref:type IV toxin-antitoxin system AbiEi family antitoxin domain-containing protein n=1 Tax=Kitasatospora griseola TaxID=2064 RepID=UPI00380ED615